MQDATCLRHLATKFACQIHLSGTGIAASCNPAEGSTGCQDTDVPPQSTAARLISDKPRASSETTFSTDTGAIQSSPDLDVLLPEEAQAEGDSAAQLTTAVPPAVEPIVVEVVRGSFASQQIGFTQQMVHRPVRYKRKNCIGGHVVQVLESLHPHVYMCA